MRSSLGRLLCLAWCLAATCAGNAIADPPPATLSPEAVADFEWFSTLGFPDVHGRPAIRIVYPGAIFTSSGPPQDEITVGFLLRREDDGRRTVLTPDLITHSFDPPPLGTPQEGAHYEEQPLVVAADDYLNHLAHLSTDVDDSVTRQSHECISERAQLFVWAWACWRNGLEEQATRFYARGASLSKMDGSTAEQESYRVRMKKALGFAMIWRAIADVANPNFTRAQLSETFERIAHEYPESRCAGLAREMADRLRAMAVEDAAHAAPAAPLDSLPLDKRIAELIFRLRDYNMSSPPTESAASASGRSGQPSNEGWINSAKQLETIGYAAVPQLIDALDNKNLSRSAGDQYVLTVGDCAQEILRAIAKRDFTPVFPRDHAMTDDEVIASVKSQVQEWWRNIQEKGEKQVLIEAVSAGGTNSARQVEELRKRYPEAALEPMIQGAKNTREDYARAVLVAQIGTVSGEQAVPFLEEELVSSSQLNVRLAAACALWQHGRGDEATAAMIHTWNKGLFTLPRESAESDDQYKGLIGFLAGCHRVDAIEALGRNLQRWPVEMRCTVVSAMDPNLSFTPRTSLQCDTGSGTADPHLRRQAVDDEAKIKAVGEALLVAELADEQERITWDGSLNGQSFSQPHVGDFAGAVLAGLFPAKYHFDLRATAKTRERQRLDCSNVWRVEHGRNPLLPPPERRIEPASEEAVTPMARTLAGSGDEETRRTADTGLMRLGLSALGPLRAYAATLPESDSGRLRLESTEKRLACTVSEVRVEAVGINDEVRNRLRARLDKLKDQPLTPAAFVALTVDLAKSLPVNVSRFETSAQRDEDCTGMRLCATLRTEQETPAKNAVWQSKQIVFEANEIVGYSCNPNNLDTAQDMNGYSDFVNAANLAFDTAPNQPLSLEVSFTAEP